MTASTRVREDTAARDELLRELDALTVPARTRIEHEDATTSWGETASLLDQLDEAVTSPSGAAGAFSARSKPPCYLDALSLLAEIDTAVGEFDRQTRAGRVRAWAAAATPHRAAETVGRWASMARTMLDPRSRRRVRGAACPECGAKRVFDARDVGAGEVHFRPALEIDTEAGVCRCTSPRCDARWPAEQWVHLALVLEQQRREEAIEEQDHDPDPVEATA